MELSTMTLGVWLVLIAAAVLSGLGKSLFPGIGMLGLALLAAVIPAKQASGISLALLIIADWAAIWAYRGQVQWRVLFRLLPNVAVGIVLGTVVLFLADDALTRRIIGGIILVFVSMTLISMLRSRRTERLQPQVPASSAQAEQAVEQTNEPTKFSRRVKSAIFGTSAGFTSMIANAGGPVTSMYFMSERLSVVHFLGTTAWFYLIVNVVKLPFSFSLGLLTPANLPIIATMIPVIVVTVLIGRRLANRIDPRVFNGAVVVLSVVAGFVLLI